MQLPIRTKVGLASAVSIAAVLLVAGLYVYLRVDRDLIHTLDKGLSSRAQTLLAGIDDSGIDFSDESSLIESDEAFGQVVSLDGEVIESSSGLKDEPLVAVTRLRQLDEPRYFTSEVATTNGTVEARLLVAPSDEGPFAIVGASLEEHDEALTRLAGALAIGGAGALAVSAFIGWLMAGRALRPVERMRQEAAAISADEPGRRLPVPPSEDEIARLGETLNLMLARLEQALERERRFVDDASHELRTPLGILRTELELALRRARTREELEAALRSAAEESERLTTLAEDLLVLARSDRGLLPVHRENTDVGALIHEAVGRSSFSAQSKGVSIEEEGPERAVATIDPTRLRQALVNLLDNALRHSPTGSVVTVKHALLEDALEVSVSDQGPGFPSGFLESAFDPFTRSDEARTRKGGGAGLGLAIVRAVAEAHGGSASALNNATGGAKVVLHIPL